MSVWDNGKDWRKPTMKEGGWVRICPLVLQPNSELLDYASGISEAPKYVEKQIKNTVLCVQK